MLAVQFFVRPPTIPIFLAVPALGLRCLAASGLTVWPIVRNSEELRKYIPDERIEGKFLVDKEFFWPVVFTVLPDWSNDYYNEVVKNRHCVKK